MKSSSPLGLTAFASDRVDDNFDIYVMDQGGSSRPPWVRGFYYFTHISFTGVESLRPRAAGFKQQTVV